MEPVLESLFPDRSSSEPLGRQLVRKLRAALEAGTFPPRSKLLPSRELAQRLGLARNTVAGALDQLVAEGYLEARVGAGTYVLPLGTRPAPNQPLLRERLPEQARQTLGAFAAVETFITRRNGPLLLGGAPTRETFPSRQWERLIRRQSLDLVEDLDYVESCGSRELRTAIARHVGLFRGIVTSPERIIITEGTQAALNLVATTLAVPGDPVAIEDPCYPLALGAFMRWGLEIVPVDVDDDGIRVDRIPRARLVYVTPSHQFPLGGRLALSRRHDLLRYAHEHDAYVIEDDYTSEYTFDQWPLPALQSLDRTERTIYIGTFSKSLAPGLRIAYVIVPAHLRTLFFASRVLTNASSARFVQRVLAAFIDEGLFAQYVRRRTSVYAERRRALLEALRAELPPTFSLGPSHAGLHLAVRGPADFDDDGVAAALAPALDVHTLSSMCIARSDCRGFAVGFTGGDVSELVDAARSLGRAVGDRVRMAQRKRRGSALGEGRPSA